MKKKKWFLCCFVFWFASFCYGRGEQVIEGGAYADLAVNGVSFSEGWFFDCNQGIDDSAKDAESVLTSLEETTLKYNLPTLEYDPPESEQGR